MSEVGATRPRTTLGAPVVRAFVGRPSAGPRQAAAWTRRRIMANNLHSVVGRAFPRVVGLTREPSWILFEMLLPFLTTSAFVFVYRALDAPAVVHRVRRAGRRDDRVLAQRGVDDGRPAVLGEGPGQPRALLRGADERDERALRDGRRRPGHELDPGGRGPGRGHASSTGSASASTSGASCSPSSC